MSEAIDVVNGIVSYTCLTFASINVVVNLVVLEILYSSKRTHYTNNFFYIIYMIGCAIDVFAMLGNHALSVFPSRGWFLSFFLSSTFPGRAFLFFSWGTRTSQGMTAFLIALNRATAVVRPLQYNSIWSRNYVRFLAVSLQLSGVVVGILAATREVYWVQVSSGGWYIQFVQNASTRNLFVGVFALMTMFLVFVIVLYTVLMYNTSSIKSRTNGFERKQEMSLLHIAIFVCIQEIIYYITYAYAFLMETNFQSDLRVFYIGYFIINDCYGGISPYLLIFYSQPVRRDFLRIFRCDNKVRSTSGVEDTRISRYETTFRVF